MSQWQPPQQSGQPWQPQPQQWPPQQQPYASHPSWQSTPPGQPWPPMQPPMPPQPQRRKPRLWLWIIGGIVLLALCSIAGHATTQSNTSQTFAEPTQAAPTPTATPTAAFMLAGIDIGDTSPDAATVAKYQRVLDDLHRKTGDDELDISNETVAAQQELAKHGQSVTLYDLMSGVDKSIPAGMKISYAEALAALVTLMTSPNQ